MRGAANAVLLGHGARESRLGVEGEQMRLSLLVCAIATIGLSSAGSASVRIYTDQGEFIAALERSVTADFNTLGNGFYGGRSYGPGSVSDHGVTVRSTNDYIFASNNNAYGTGSYLQIQQGTPTDATFSVATAGNAFGFNVAGGAPISLTFGSDTVILPINGYPSFSYIGFIADHAGTSVTLSSPGGGVDVDNITFGNGDGAGYAPREYAGGTPGDPERLSGTAVTDVGGHISGQYGPQAYVGFDWAGGDFTALGALTGADPAATFSFNLYASGDPLDPLTTVSLTNANSFSGFLSRSLAAGSYSIGFTTTSAFDPDWTIRLETPVAGDASAAPEPATWAMTVAGFGLIGGTMRRRARVPARA